MHAGRVGPMLHAFQHIKCTGITPSISDIDSAAKLASISPERA
ncbi:hypothetical protein SSE37_24814 [Sagittula stellata E-37]|uniref:Uncharacterized protein n=1 Tax=Sagittula stellata (strain ATCC 700073 / DSM 11524 / E-37) TaxID=388399 RepID=A3K158_SAGS3|nr:hypothetical protein SSE37_24814 [Sagittula stellata E-37]